MTENGMPGPIPGAMALGAYWCPSGWGPCIWDLFWWPAEVLQKGFEYIADNMPIPDSANAAITLFITEETNVNGDGDAAAHKDLNTVVSNMLAEDTGEPVQTTPSPDATLFQPDATEVRWEQVVGRDASDPNDQASPRFYSIHKYRKMMAPDLLVKGSYVATETEDKQRVYEKYFEKCVTERDRRNILAPAPGHTTFCGSFWYGGQLFFPSEVEFVQDLHLGWLPSTALLGGTSYLDNLVGIYNAQQMHGDPNNPTHADTAHEWTLDRFMSQYFDSYPLVWQKEFFPFFQVDNYANYFAWMMRESVQQQTAAHGDTRNLYAFHNRLHRGGENVQGRMSFVLYIFERDLGVSNPCSMDVSNGKTECQYFPCYLHVFLVHRGMQNVVAGYDDNQDMYKIFNLLAFRTEGLKKILPNQVVDDLREGLEPDRIHGEIARFWDETTNPFVQETMDTVKALLTGDGKPDGWTVGDFVTISEVRMHHIGHSLGGQFALWSSIRSRYELKSFEETTGPSAIAIYTTLTSHNSPALFSGQQMEELAEKNYLPPRMYMAWDGKDNVMKATLLQTTIVQALNKFNLCGKSPDDKGDCAICYWEQKRCQDDATGPEKYMVGQSRFGFPKNGHFLHAIKLPANDFIWEHAHPMHFNNHLWLNYYNVGGERKSGEVLLV